MQDHAGALGMAEETRAQARAFMRAFDQAGQIGDHEIGAADAHHAELRIQRGERVIGDFRLGRGDAREESRFARIGQADQADIGDQLQPQPDGFFFCRLAGIGVARRLVGRTLEMRIAEAAIAAL